MFWGSVSHYENGQYDLTSLTYRTEEIKLLKANKIDYCRRDIQILPVDIIIESKIIYSCHHQKCEETALYCLCFMSSSLFSLFFISGNQFEKECWKNEERTLKRKEKYIDWGLKMTAKTKTTLGTETLRSRCSIAGTVCAVFTVPLRVPLS